MGGGVLHCATLKRVAAIVEGKVELDSTFCNDFAAPCLAMILAVARYVTLYNGSCNFADTSCTKNHTL